jgi:hypothetical protein
VGTGVTALDGAEAAPVPTAFVALTVNVYAVPFVRPATVMGLPDPVPVWPPGLAVTVYEVIAEPPFEEGALNDTVADALPATADTPVGAPGTVAPRVTGLDAAEADPVPTELVAVTVNV